MEKYFEFYDAFMEVLHSYEADEQYYEEMEEELNQSLYEEYMWYKYEDYMLWEHQSLENKLMGEGYSKKEAIAINVFAYRNSIEHNSIASIIEEWKNAIELSIKLGYSLDMICDTVLYDAVDNEEYYGVLADKAKEVFCK